MKLQDTCSGPGNPCVVLKMYGMRSDEARMIVAGEFEVCDECREVAQAMVESE